MILVDLNQVIIANLMMQKEELNEGLVRHQVLNSLRSYLVKFRENYGELVICCDSKHYWRQDFFPNYKKHRKKEREKSKVDWKALFESIRKVTDELKENFPHKVLEIDGAEADDIIGTLVEKCHDGKILILSSDSDFIQLQKYPGVIQYSPALKKFITVDGSPEIYIKEHIICGDYGDGIPNFLSDDDVILTEGKRQKRISKEKLSKWVTQEPKEFCTTEIMQRGYRRNERLIDLSFTPVLLKEKIVEEFKTIEPASRQKFYKYCIDHRLSKLMEKLDDF